MSPKSKIALDVLVYCLLLSGAAGCGRTDRSAPEGHLMQLTSGSFRDGATIPQEFTEDGEDRSPPLEWSGGPPNVQSWALVCEDPDAPTAQPWVHWILYNVPASVNRLPEGIGREPTVASLSGAMQGPNSWPKDNVGYRGPAPPPGSGPHHYHFRLYALDCKLQLQPASATVTDLRRAMKGHVLAEGELVGVYQR